MEKLIRAFFAVEVNRPVRAALARTIQPLKRELPGRSIRWVARENLHVTLRFLGNIPAGRVAGLLELARRECEAAAPFELKAAAIGWFPAGRRPRAIAAALEPEADLKKLAGCVERAAAAAGLPGQDRPFRPHLTLGRFKESRDLLRTRRFPETGLLPAWRVDRVVLFQSQLTRDGPVYTPLGECGF